jgi:hypothetical protein
MFRVVYSHRYKYVHRKLKFAICKHKCKLLNSKYYFVNISLKICMVQFFVLIL